MKQRWSIVAIAAVVAAVIWSWTAHSGAPPTADRLLLLVPDGTSLSDPKVNLWLDAASEEGLHLTPLHDSEFARPLFGHPAGAGVILPDSFHQQAGDLLISAVRRFVAGGGKLMLVYDAGTLSSQGKYAMARSRFSDLAGVDYGLYDTLKDKTIQWESVSGDSAHVRELGIPPGKYYPFDTAKSPASPGKADEVTLRRYKYGDVKYPSFVTSGTYSGQVLLHSPAGIAAGEHKYDQGSVLFVNLPLGYLKANTDGLLLHAFLKHFVTHTLSLPYLLAVPDGIGGLILNWHVDSNAAIAPLQEMKSWTLLQRQGPYSIHVTAGPDDAVFGDGEGFDIEHNRQSQELVLDYSRMGNQIGSHGGWIHDYFSHHVEKDPPADLEKFLSLNQNALQRETGRPVVEYSAPDGNQPQWVTTWLEAHGFIGYYFTGNTGMGPTQGYRDGLREGQNIWAFPILHLDRAAGFEEMKLGGYSDREILSWLEAVAEFTVGQHSARLIYFHPPGILPYKHVFLQWLETTARMKAEGRFRWYTMTELANFLNSRKQVVWKLSERDGAVSLEASHPRSLEHQAWCFPADRFSKPRIVSGSATVTNDQSGWNVVAGEGKYLQIETDLLVQ